jgi:uracil-DNA glycosylase
MASDKLDKIIDDAIEYVANMKRFYNLYAENPPKLSERNYTEPSKDSNILVKDENSIDMKPVAKEQKAETDLFGNVINAQEDWESSLSLGEMNTLICECLKCPLGKTRTKFVFGVGNPSAEIVLIGEAPGAEEDLQGEPFVGRAGKLLDKILEAIGFKREDVYICNILKCRPPGNRNPLPEEIETCLPYLHQQIKLIKPKMILLLGRVAAEALLKTKQPLNKLRGKIHYYNGFKTLVTFHPAALLRNPQWKRPAWEDMQEFKRIYDSLTSADSVSVQQK